MKTLNEIRNEIAAQNHSRISIVNDVEIELTNEEFEASLDAKAQMIFEQEQDSLQKDIVLQAKISAYEKLGLTEVEIEALLTTPKLSYTFTS